MTTLAGSKGALFPFSPFGLPTPRLRGGDVPQGVGGSERGRGQRSCHEPAKSDMDRWSDDAARSTGVLPPLVRPNSANSPTPSYPDSANPDKPLHQSMHGSRENGIYSGIFGGEATTELKS